MRKILLDPYDVRWPALIAAEPLIPRSLGAAAADDTGDGDDGGDGGDDGGDGGDGDKGGDKGGDSGDSGDAGDDGDKGKDFSADEASWRTTLKDKDAIAEAKRYDSVDSLAKSLVETKKALRERIPIPGKDAKPEDIAKFRKAAAPILGEIPEKAEDYQVVDHKPEHLSDDEWKSEQVQGTVNSIAELGIKHGIPKAFMGELLDTYFGIEAEAVRMIKEADTKALETLEAENKKLWGADYDANTRIAKATIEKYDDAGLADFELRDGSKVGQNPGFIRLMSKLGRMREEGDLEFGQAGTAAGADIQKAIDDLTDKIHAANARGDNTAASKLINERRPLLAQLHGTGGEI